MKEVGSLEREITVTGVAADENWSKVTLVGVPSDVQTLCAVFSALAQAGINVDMIVQAAASKGRTHLSFTVTREDLAEALGLSTPLGRIKIGKYSRTITWLRYP